MFERARSELEARIEEIGRMAKLYAEALSILKRIAKRIDRRDPVNHLVRQVHGIRARCREFEALFQAASNLAFTDSYERQIRDRVLRSEDLSPLEKQREQADRDIQYVEGLAKSIERLREMLEGALAVVEPEVGEG